VGPNDRRPGGPPSRTITVQLTRDSLILIVALIFLAIAILLAVIFPASGPGITSQDATSTAGSAAASPAPRVTSTSIIFIPSPPAGTAEPTSEVGADVPTSEAAPTEQPGYPGPETPLAEGTPDESATSLTAGPAGEGETAIPTFGLPTFAPARPTAPSDVTSDAAGGTLPGDAAATPTEPRFNVPTFTPTDQPTPDDQSEPTESPTEALPTEPRPTRTPRPQPRPTPRPTPAPTEVPINILRGNLRWTPANGPITLRRDTLLAPGATLIIEAGTEVRLAPGVSFFVGGTLYGIGAPGRPVRFVGSEPQRWEGLFGRPGGSIALVHTDISGGGAGGTVIASDDGNLVLQNDQIHNNGGHIAVNNSRLEIRDSEISGNDMPYGAAVDATYENGGFVTLTGNRIGGNRMAAGAAPAQINNQSPTDAVNLDIQRNLLVGQDGPDLVLFQDGPFQGGLDVTLPNAGPFLGAMTCNALMSGANGLNIRSNTTQVPRLNMNVRDNAIENHSPPIVPIYTQPYHGIGRGATSEILIDMGGNWWGDPAGPYEPDRHADGRGDAVGDMIIFDPWLTERPACAPKP
jgi:Right handed beta helix region